MKRDLEGIRRELRSPLAPHVFYRTSGMGQTSAAFFRTKDLEEAVFIAEEQAEYINESLEAVWYFDDDGRKWDLINNTVVKQRRKKRMAKKSKKGTDLLAALNSSRGKKAGRVSPKDAPKPKTKKAKRSKKSRPAPEPEPEDLGFDLEKPLKKWLVKELSAYLRHIGQPSQGKKKALYAAVETAMKLRNSEALEDEEEDEVATLERKLAAAKKQRKTKRQPDPEPDEWDDDEEEEDEWDDDEDEDEEDLDDDDEDDDDWEEDEDEEDEDEDEEDEEDDPEPEEPGEWGEYALFVDCHPTRDPYATVYLSDLLAEPRRLVAESEEVERDDDFDQPHWDAAKFRRGGAMVAQVFRAMLDEQQIVIHRRAIVCFTAEPGQAEAISVLMPNRQRGAIR